MLRLLESQTPGWRTNYMYIINYIHILCMKAFFLYRKYKWWSNIQVHDKKCDYLSLFLYFIWNPFFCILIEKVWSCEMAHWECTITVNVVFLLKNLQNHNPRQNWKKFQTFSIYIQRKGYIITFFFINTNITSPFILSLHKIMLSNIISVYK